MLSDLGVGVCPSCGAAVETEWRHCGACGTALDGTAVDGTAVDGTAVDGAAGVAPAGVAPPPRPRWHRLFVVEQPALFLAALIVVLLLGAGAAIVSEQRLDDKRAELARVQRSLRDTETVLAATRGELNDRMKERDALRADLDKVRSSLTDAERSVKSQGDQLATFKNCLSAIEEFGVAIDRGDSSGARAAGERADRFCTEALALL